MLRHFVNKTCSQYETKRLPSEEAAFIHRPASKAKTGGTAPQGKQAGGGSMMEDGPDVKRFNLATYKIHALGDYADHIERFGPTDCFTTQHLCHFSFGSDGWISLN
jgi:hypothetical protein